MAGKAKDSRAKLDVLWLYEAVNSVPSDLLADVLTNGNPELRVAGTRALSQGIDRIPDSLDQLTKLVSDDHARVRLEALRAPRESSFREIRRTRLERPRQANGPVPRLRHCSR